MGNMILEHTYEIFHLLSSNNQTNTDTYKLFLTSFIGMASNRFHFLPPEQLHALEIFAINFSSFFEGNMHISDIATLYSMKQGEKE